MTYVFAPFAGTLGHANSQFGDGFFRVRERQNVFAEQRIVGFEQVPDAFGDDARLAGARPAMTSSGPSPCVMARRCASSGAACAFRLPHFKKESWPSLQQVNAFCGEAEAEGDQVCGFTSRYLNVIAARLRRRRLCVEFAGLFAGMVTAVHWPDWAAKCLPGSNLADVVGVVSDLAIDRLHD